MNFIFCNLMLLQSPIIDNTQVWVPWKLQLITVEMRQWSCWRLLSQVRWNDPIFIFILWYMNIYYIIYKYIISPCNLSKPKCAGWGRRRLRKYRAGLIDKICNKIKNPKVNNDFHEYKSHIAQMNYKITRRHKYTPKI